MPTSLIAALTDPHRYPHPVERVESLETHISWVLLAGEYAYKIKKPVSLGFLDFGTLEARRRFCEEELRLNRRTAPGLYLEVVSITGSPEAPVLGGAGPAIEYAVKMRRFAEDALLDRVARRGALDAATVDRLARAVADFHASAAIAPPASPFGTAETIAANALANFEHIARLAGDSPERPLLERLRAWTERALAQLAPVFAARKALGRVRECHGDLHLGNLALLEGAPTPFDCIEFSAELRWIDVMSEIAFLMMDLTDHGLPRLAFRCLNGYLEAGGDYGGLAVLRHYLVYRAMVRAKVACIRAHQGGIGPVEHGKAEGDYRDHLRLAERLAAPGTPALVLMHGVSGTGKSTLAQALAERLGAVQVRSDVERKRLHGLDAAARSASALGAGLYREDATRRTYAQLAEAAHDALAAGWPAIADATFIGHATRDLFRGLARELRVPFAIVSCTAPESVLRERIAARERLARDASEASAAVLERQLAIQQPLGADEAAQAIAVDAAQPFDADALAARLAVRLASAAGSEARRVGA
jgi:aminoglycoside phosphotransferase family enzyme/predicted kinase